MYVVYILKSIKFPNHIYIGFTENIKTRLSDHNNGQVSHTTKYKPWKVISSITFQQKTKAVAFEKYLKSGSGRQFIYRHFI